MCGFAFLHAPTATNAQARQQMQDCLEAMQHRGPDDNRITQVKNTLLGHRRLSIVDLAGSPQPMVDPTARYYFAYNGEIYNYREIRTQLEHRWTFTTQGDTEVLLAGLLLIGVDFLNQLEGMWAFALWDSLEETLLLGRDRMGKKPLFYQTLTNAKEAGFACASELAALRKLSDTSWHEDFASTSDYFRYGYCLPGFTFYKEVKEVPPGHVLTWDTTQNSIRLAPYWQLQISAYRGTYNQAKEELRSTFVNAVKRRLVADVEIGAFLSGGIDSSLVCAIAQQELRQPLKTFTIGFHEASFDERAFARQAAEAIGTEHYEEILATWNESELEQLLRQHVGQPFADPSLLPTHLVSKVAAKHVKVALSG